MLGRAAELIAIVVLNAARINAVEIGSITFTWSPGGRAKVDLRDYDLERPDVETAPERAA